MNKNTVACDKASARSYDANGHLIVDSTVITKAAVNPYYSKEIPEDRTFRDAWIVDETALTDGVGE